MRKWLVEKFNIDRWIWLIILLILAITVMHLLTRQDAMGVHEFLRRLYYLPIILSAYKYGLRGGLVASIISSVMYAPHLLLYMGTPGILMVNQLMEILLFIAVGTITGVMSGLEQKQKQQLRDQLQQLRRMEEEVRVADRLGAVGQLASGVAHEIRNPIGIIGAAAQIAREEAGDNRTVQDSLKIILKEVDRANQVVSGLLDFSRPSRMEFSSVDIGEVANEAMQLTMQYAAQHGIALKVIIPKQRPLVVADREKLKQAIINLVFNAVQSSKAGGTIQVALKEAASEDDPTAAGVSIEISDEGSGIPPEMLSRVFDPFFTTRDKGTGLGLAIVHRIVRDHGGQIRIESEPGRGTTVFIWLPKLKQRGSSDGEAADS
ncbi:MAG: DUF4118 domain-containing protein [Firmicutes bacterium]|nr:DUF4118 domain-containing protein [Bacillota bacterium]